MVHSLTPSHATTHTRAYTRSAPKTVHHIASRPCQYKIQNISVRQTVIIQRQSTDYRASYHITAPLQYVAVLRSKYETRRRPPTLSPKPKRNISIQLKNIQKTALTRGCLSNSTHPSRRSQPRHPQVCCSTRPLHLSPTYQPPPAPPGLIEPTCLRSKSQRRLGPTSPKQRPHTTKLPSNLPSERRQQFSGFRRDTEHSDVCRLLCLRQFLSRVWPVSLASPLLLVVVVAPSVVDR